MPVSKSRKKRRTHRGNFLGLPQAGNLDGLLERGRRLVALRGTNFDDAEPGDVLSVLFEGWALVGHRASQDHIAGGIDTYVWHRPDLLVGFHLLMSPPSPSALSEEGEIVPDYLRLMASAHRPVIRAWEALTGTERVRRVFSGLSGQGPGQSLVVGDNPLTFVDAVAACYEECRVGDPVGHLRDMANIVLTEPISDPDGHAEAVRSLAGLGAYSVLTH